MGAIEHLTISLSEEAAEKLRARAVSGDHRDISAVVEEALATLDMLDDGVAEVLSEIGDELPDWFRAQVAAACEEIDRDPFRAIPIDQVRADLRAGRIARGE